MVHSVRAHQVTPDASNTSICIDVPLEAGATFVDRFAESYAALLNTAVRAVQERLTSADRARIPSRHSCERLLELCGHIHTLAAIERDRGESDGN